MTRTFDSLRAAVLICICCTLIQTVANAQSARDRRRDDEEPSEKELQDRLSKAEENLVTEYKDVAIEYYKQGDKAMSMKMLRRLKELSPDLDGLDDRIDSISEELLQENEDEFEFDVRNHQWQLAGLVLEDKAFRLQSAGETKITYTATVGVDGLEVEDQGQAFVNGLPIGTLMGIVIPHEKPKRGEKRSQRPQPFRIGSQVEYTPTKSGQLFLKVNVPPTARCSGKIKIRVSGYIDRGQD